MRLELVRDWMTRQVTTIAPEANLAEARKLMTAQEVRRLPVVENGRPIGIITLSDIRAAGEQRKVADIMSADPITISPDVTIGAAAKLMLQHKISGLPVLDPEEKLVGIITESDIFRMVVHDWIRAADEDNEPYSHYQ